MHSKSCFLIILILILFAPLFIRSQDINGSSNTTLSQSTISSSDTALSERYLVKLASTYRRGRIMGGVAGIVLGTASATLGIAGMNESDGESKAIGKYFFVGGVLIDAWSVWQLASPSSAEEDYNRVQSITDLAEREKEGHESLKSLASQARTYRLISGGILLLAGGIAAILPEDNKHSRQEELPMKSISIATCIVSGAIMLAVHFPAENALYEYEKENQDKKFSYRLGLDTGKRIIVNFTYTL